MRFSSIALSAVAATGALAGNSRSHARMHREKALAARDAANNAKRDTLISATAVTNLLNLGFTSAGKNAVSSSEGDVWVGTDGKFTNTYINQGEEDIILVVWGPVASWVNAHQPEITLEIPAGTNTTLSFADGISGAWAAVYNDTKLVNGQVSETWGEYTMKEGGCVDVSREVNMQGHNMTIEAPDCTSDMDTCVFKCKGLDLSCWLEYELQNCEPGSQKGATYGLFAGAPTGGCGNFPSEANLKTYFH